MPVLTPGRRRCGCCTCPTCTCVPRQRRKQAWLRELATLAPDLVVNTGDNLSHPKAVPAVVQALGDLLSVPGVFVFGSNDYFAPTPEEPGELPVQQEVAAHPRGSAALAGPAGRVHRARLAGHDAHPPRARCRRAADRRRRRRRSAPQAGPLRDHRRNAQPGGNLSLGVTHSPEPRVLDRFAADGYQLVMAGHTHGGQLCLPFYGAIVDQLRAGPLTGQGPVPVGRRHAAARVGGHRHLARTRRCGSAAGRRPPC